MLILLKIYLFLIPIAAFNAVFLDTLRNGVLSKLYGKWQLICPKFLRKSTIECYYCQSFWLSVIQCSLLCLWLGKLTPMLFAFLIMITTIIICRLVYEKD